MIPLPPLPGDIVNLTLHYLLPPVAPLPPHLISKELLQRHHFLNIDPSDTELYFCWPSSRFSDPLESPIHALELLAGNNELLEKSGHNVTYESDSETSRAFVQVSDNVQVVFVWQDVSEETLSMGGSRESGWHFHDVRRSINKALARPNDSIYGDDAPGDDSSRSSSASSNVYWDSYAGISVPGSPVMSRGARLHIDAQESLEDAYWNLYSTVQGTADSTVPSPRLDLQNERRRRSDNYESRVPGIDNVSFDAYERISAPEAECCGLSSEYRTLGPVHPQEAGINSHGAEEMNEGRVLCSYNPEQYTEGVEPHAARLARALLPLLSLQGYIEKNPPQEEPSSDSVDDRDVLEVARTSPPSSPRSDQSAASMEPQFLNQSSSDAPLDEVEKAVVESVQGLYKLWISSNRRSPAGCIVSADQTPRKAFLSLVQRALD